MSLARSAVSSLLLTAALVLLSACEIAESRSIQDDFMVAVQIDNESAVSPFAASVASPRYRAVIARLTAEKLEAMTEPKLALNALMMKAVAQWRLAVAEGGAEADALFTAARSTAAAGLRLVAADPTLAGSRDHLLLTMIPALVVDSDVRHELPGDGDAVSPEAAARLGPQVAEAILAMRDAEPAITRATPVEVRDYFRYHYWRMLSNWRLLVAAIEDDDLRATERGRAATLLGQSLKNAADAQRDRIPAASPLRTLITSLGGG